MLLRLALWHGERGQGGKVARPSTCRRHMLKARAYKPHSRAYFVTYNTPARPPRPTFRHILCLTTPTRGRIGLSLSSLSGHACWRSTFSGGHRYSAPWAWIKTSTQCSSVGKSRTNPKTSSKVPSWVNSMCPSSWSMTKSLTRNVCIPSFPATPSS